MVKKITTAKDIFEKKEREERQKRFPQVRSIITRVNLPPQMIKRLEEIMAEEEKKRKERTEINKKWKLATTVISILVLITIALGSLWLIKIFLGGIFGW